jgi:hypothetical protein
MNNAKTTAISGCMIWALIGLIISVVLTFVFAVPGGMLVTKVLNKMKSPRVDGNVGNNIER